MNDSKKPLNEGYGPQNDEVKRGYQPQVDTDDQRHQGGYTPTDSGESPTNQPQPPDEE